MTKVPKIFHFVFGLREQKEPFHLMYYLCLASCIKVNKPEKIYFHYKNMPYGEWWDRIKPYLSLNRIQEDSFISSYAYKDKVYEKYRYAHLSDITRLEMLIKYGGIYADMDTIFVNEIPDSFYEKTFILGREKVNWMEDTAKTAGGSLCNAWILSEKESEFGKRWLEKTYEEFDGSWSNHSTFLPYKLSLDYPELIHIEPERSFFNFSWSKEGLKDLFENIIPDLSGIYSIHLWSHLWWDKGRRDFSYFHNGRLTCNYVTYADTTYSSIAKKFLSEDVSVNLTKYKIEEFRAVFEDIIFNLHKHL